MQVDALRGDSGGAGDGAQGQRFLAVEIFELAPWQRTHLGPVEVTAAPASHGIPELTFVLRADGHSVFFGADTLRIAELDEIARRFPELDLALLPVNGLRIRPALNKQVVMDAVEAADLTRTLRPRVAVPIHYAFSSGPLGDRVMTKGDREAAEHFRAAAADLAPEPIVQILPTGHAFAL
ncbi:MBL fold metallo-hydrolase [Nocardia niigatensis]|uniref:MBL fold metallo-hydrolase n=1 Tax=Nocardia niigatensis TaxID=209249 RepID=UPI0002F9C245|nr:MBL fold metallo-hydrolase [Nocardia niigatensis]